MQLWTPLSDAVWVGYFYGFTMMEDKLVAGGSFQSINGVRAWNIAKYDFAGATWSPLASGNDGIVYASLSYDGKVYVGGDFNRIGGIDANNIAVFDPATSTWSAVGSTSQGTNGQVRCIATSNNKIYVGGVFSQAGSISASNIACWDPSSCEWMPLGQGISGGTQYQPAAVNAICGVGNQLYAAGTFLHGGEPDGRKHCLLPDGDKQRVGLAFTPRRNRR